MQDKTEHQAPCQRSRTWRISPLTLLAGGLDLAIVYLWLSARIDTRVALLEHVTMAVLLCAVAIAWQRRFTPETAVIGGALLLLGPLGGIVLLIIELGSGSRPFETERAERHTEVISDPARRVTAQIRQNRRPSLNASRPQSFEKVLRSGSLTQQQDAIATILRHYQPELLALLKQALASPVPAIRVQAAAVYAKLRGTFEARAKAILAACEAPESIFDLKAFAAEAEAVARSGFVDAETQMILRAAANRRTGKPSNEAPDEAQGGNLMVVHSGQAIPQAPNLKRYSCGGVA